MSTSWVRVRVMVRAQLCRHEEAACMCAQSVVLIWGALWGEPDGNAGRKTTSDQINCQTTKPIGGSRLSERFVPEIYGGSQGCRADVYRARCKFRSALSQIYDLCFPSALAPSPSLPWEPQVSVMRVVEWFHTGWGFQPGVLNPNGFGGTDNNAVCVLLPEYLQPITKIFIAIVLASFLSSSLCCCAQS